MSTGVCMCVCSRGSRRKIERRRLGERDREEGEKGEREGDGDHCNEVSGMLMCFQRYAA